jgi:hypothetical protein
VPEAPADAKTTRRILWLGALLLVPLPMIKFAAWIPVTRYLLLGAVTGGLILTEGSGRIPNAFLIAMLGHAIFYAALLWAVAWALARTLQGAAPAWARSVALALVAAGVLAALLTEPYVTPFAADAPRASLLTVLR